MKVFVENQQDEFAIDLHSITPIVEFVLAHENYHTDEVTVFFVSEQRICDIHAQFFNDPSPTDCISFPMDNEPGSSFHVLGDIFVSPKAAFDYIQTDASQDFNREVALYVIHGILHLLGYRDDTPAARKKMHLKQNQYLNDFFE